MRTKILVALAVVVGFLTGTAVLAGSGNDRVLKEDKYIEVFKQEGRGDKNYLYTITEFKDGWGRNCTTTTGASETAISTDCDYPQVGDE